MIARARLLFRVRCIGWRSSIRESTWRDVCSQTCLWNSFFLLPGYLNVSLSLSLFVFLLLNVCVHVCVILNFRINPYMIVCRFSMWDLMKIPFDYPLVVHSSDFLLDICLNMIMDSYSLESSSRALPYTCLKSNVSIWLQLCKDSTLFFGFSLRR